MVGFGREPGAAGARPRARRHRPRRPARWRRRSTAPRPALPAARWARCRTRCRRALDAAGEDCVVTDVGSTKAHVVDAIADERFVGGHPMAGRGDQRRGERARRPVRGRRLVPDPLRALLGPAARAPAPPRALLRRAGRSPSTPPPTTACSPRSATCRTCWPTCWWPRPPRTLARRASRCRGWGRASATPPAWPARTPPSGPTSTWPTARRWPRRSTRPSSGCRRSAASLRSGDADALASWNDAAREDRRRLLEADLAGEDVHELQLTVPNRPGIVAQVALALGRAGLNIVGPGAGAGLGHAHRRDDALDRRRGARGARRRADRGARLPGPAFVVAAPLRALGAAARPLRPAAGQVDLAPGGAVRRDGRRAGDDPQLPALGRHPLDARRPADPGGGGGRGRRRRGGARRRACTPRWRPPAGGSTSATPAPCCACCRAGWPGSPAGCGRSTATSRSAAGRWTGWSSRCA